MLAPAPHDWARAYQRLALERPLVQERRPDPGPSLLGPIALLGPIGLYCVGSSANDAWLRGDRILAIVLVLGALVAVVGRIATLGWLRKYELIDPRQVQAKLCRDSSPEPANRSLTIQCATAGRTQPR